MKLITEEVVNGENVIRVYTTVNALGAAATAKLRPGIGKPYWSWPTIPPGKVIGVDFTGAPIAKASTQDNLADINAITATPQEKLIYDSE